MRTSPLPVSAFLAVVAACAAETHDKAPPLPASESPSLSETVRAADRRMHDRFVFASQIERELAGGNLELARASAHVIAQLEEPDALPIWQPFLATTRDAARQIERAEDLAAAATATGLLGLRCAQCHQAIAAKVVFRETPQPPRDTKLATQMLGHQWATEMMWQGVIGPAPERWTRGAELLATVPLNIVAQAVTPSFQGDVDDVARVRMFARRAATMTTTEQRAELFGTMLGTCAHCHSMLRDR